MSHGESAAEGEVGGPSALLKQHCSLRSCPAVCCLGSDQYQLKLLHFTPISRSLNQIQLRLFFFFFETALLLMFPSVSLEHQHYAQVDWFEYWLCLLPCPWASGCNPLGFHLSPGKGHSDFVLTRPSEG